MAMTTETLSLTQRTVLNKVYLVASKKQRLQYKTFIGHEVSTSEKFYNVRQLKDIGTAEYTPEGEQVRFDDMAPLFPWQAQALKYTKGLRMTEEAEFELQFKEVLDRQNSFARAFARQRNRVGANLLNLGFTSTAYGVNTETLFATSHSMGGSNVFSNRPATDIALSPLALEQGLTELRRQVDANGDPMGPQGDIWLVVPPELEYVAKRITEPDRLAFTNNNDTNPAGRKVDVAVVDWLTSTRAWFLIAKDPEEQSLYMVNGMPYRMTPLPIDKALWNTWVAREKYTVGWPDAHGVWGTTGA